MQELVRNLDDATAIRVLRTVSTARSRHGNYETQWSSELRRALLEGGRSLGRDRRGQSRGPHARGPVAVGRRSG